MEDSLAVTADICSVIEREQAALIFARADFAHKALGHAQDTRDDVGLECVKFSLQVGIQDTGVYVDQVTKTEHFRTVHKVLPVM